MTDQDEIDQIKMLLKIKYNTDFYAYNRYTTLTPRWVLCSDQYNTNEALDLYRKFHKLDIPSEIEAWRIALVL